MAKSATIEESFEKLDKIVEPVVFRPCAPPDSLRYLVILESDQDTVHRSICEDQQHNDRWQDHQI